MIEILLLLSILTFAILTSKEKIIYLIVFLLPLHTFIKSYFEFTAGGGNLFSAWKEIVILILFLKVVKSSKVKLSKQFSLMINGFLFIIALFYVLSNDHMDSLATLRDHLFPILLFLAVYRTSIDMLIVKKIVFFFGLSVLINCVMGFVQNFFFNIPISMLMGRIDFIDSSGYIQYKTSSARIMGFERMSGIMGGPNTFGTFCAFCAVFFLGISFNAKKMAMTFLQRNAITLLVFICIACLLFSFSRAGYIIFLVGGIILMKVSNKIKPSMIISTFIIITITSFIVLEYFPFVSEVILSSVSGKEESAADRSNNFSAALDINLTEPMGHGLGTTDHRYKSFEFFAESAFMNIAYEIGLLGLSYLIVLHLVIAKMMSRLKNSTVRPFSKLAISLTLPTLLVCFVSINPYAIPYIYLWWLVLALGLNNSELMDGHANNYKLQKL